MKFVDKIATLKPELCPIIRMGSPDFNQLNQPSIFIQSISPRVQVYIDCLKITAADEGIISLSAKQIGIFQSLFVKLKKYNRNQWYYKNTKPGDYEAFINPTLIVAGKLKQVEWEQCSTFPYFVGKIARADKIKYSFRNEQFEYKEQEAEDFQARIIQHEIDHLKGHLIDGATNCLKESHKEMKQNAFIDINMEGIKKNVIAMNQFKNTLSQRANQQ